MMDELVEVLNTRTGARGSIYRHLFENPAFNNGILIEVDADTKPYVPELYKSKTGTDSDVEDSSEDDELNPDDEETDTEEED